jgi:hypothetical protein
MKKFTTLIVALAMVFTLASSFTVKAESGRDNLGNKAATMVFTTWHQVGFDRDGNYLNPSNVDPASIEESGADGTGYQLFPWQKQNQQVWGRYDAQYPARKMPRLLSTRGHSPLGRTIPANRDYNNNYTMNTYAYWTEFFLTVTPKSGASQEYAHWYAVLDKEGNLWLDPDGIFHACGLDSSADPMFFAADLRTYNEGSCLYNPKATLDPLPNNNTQGPYKMIFTDSTTPQEIYFWWKFDSNGNLVDRVWRIGWADMNDYSPVPNPAMGWNPNDPNLSSAVGYTSAYDPFLKTTVTQKDIDWDYKLLTMDFAPSSAPWPNVMEGAECYFDENGNGSFDPFEPIYRKSTGNNANTVEVNDIRCVNMSVVQGSYVANYKHDTVVANIDYDFGRALLPINSTNAPAGTPWYVHTHGQTAGNPNARYDYDEFIYRKNSAYNPTRTTLTIGMVPGDNLLNVASTAGFAVGDTVLIYGVGLDQHEIRTIASIINATQMTVTSTVTSPHPAGSWVVKQGYVDFGDIRMTPVNHRFNNSTDSRAWLGSWETDTIVLLEVLNGGCDTEMYNITVECDIWDGMVPALTAAALRTPNGDIVAAAQRIQMTTVLDPTGLEFRVPGTTFENIKFAYREYLGVEIFKDDGINNNLGATPVNNDVIRASLSDDYSMWRNTEEFVGSADEETAKDYAWSIATRPFFADEMYIDLNGDGFLGNGEPMYRDTDFSRTITAGDIRINDITIDNTLTVTSYAAGSRITAGDVDIMMQLSFPAIWTPQSIPLSVRYNDQQHGCEPPNTTYDIGEPIYFNPALSANQTILYSNDFEDVPSPPWPNNWDPANWTLVEDMTSACGFGRSWSDPNYSWGPGTETLWNYNPASPIGAAAQLDRGFVINNASMVSGPTQTFITDFFYRPEMNIGWGDQWFNAFGIVFGYLNDANFYALYIAPNYDDTGYEWVYSDSCNFSNSLWGMGYTPPNTVRMIVMRVVGGQIVNRIILPTYIWTNWNNPLHFEIIMTSPTSVILNLSSFASQVDLTTLLTQPGWALPGTGFGFTKFGDDGTGWAMPGYWDFKDPAYIDNVLLLRPAPGLSGNPIRLTDVWVGDAFYPAGSQVLSGDFYRIKNPVYGVTTGANCSKRYMDAAILPGSIGLDVQIDPAINGEKRLKVEQTSHIKITTKQKIEGEYVAGKVIGDKRTRLYYRPDSFILNTIPVQYQVIYSSRDEAEMNFYKPDKSVNGDVVYVSLRSTDFTEGNTVNSIREIYEKVGIIDAKNPVIDWQFTPYRGTILDDIGQEMPVLIKAYLDKGGVYNAPEDSHFSNAINFNNSATRTVDPTTTTYYTENYIDPWQMTRKWDLRESYASYYNQAYTRACRIVYSPYEVDKISACALGDRYDCFGMEKITVEPEGINIVPSSPCVDPLSYRYPNITLTLKSFDNPNDVNDPSGYNMAVEEMGPRGTATNSFIATYNANGAGIRYMCMFKEWNRYGGTNRNNFYIMQVHDDGSYLCWILNEPNSFTPYPQIRGCIDPNDSFTPLFSAPFGTSNYSARGSNVYDVGDADCSVGTGTRDICGSGFPPLGDVNLYDTYSSWFDPQNPYLGNGELYHYGVYSYVTGKTSTEQGGLMAVCAQPIDSNSKLNIRVHATNVVIDYNSVDPKNPGPKYLADNISAVHQAVQANGTSRFNPSISPDYRSNPPGIRYLPSTKTIDYCDIISLKVLAPDLDLNFNNLYMVDHALQFSEIGYTGSDNDVAFGNAMVRNDNPEKWIMPRYNPFCSLRALSSDVNTDVRSYPGGQSNLGRVANGQRGNGYNAYPAMWRKMFSKLGSEFYGLTDYGLYFELSEGRSGGSLLSFYTGTVNRIEIDGPFMTPLDIDPNLASIKYRAGTASGSTTGYEYKGLRFVPIKYDYTGKITVNPLNYLAYELGANNYSSVISPGCTSVGDRITSTNINPYMLVGKELDYTRVSRPGGVRVFVFDELIPIGPGRINITVWLTSGVKKVYQDCCISPPANGIDVSGIKIDNMPQNVTVNEANVLKLTLTEGYGVKSDGPPQEFGLGPQDNKECNDALVYVWQDRGVMDPIDKLYQGAGDGYVTKPPQSTDITATYIPFNPEDDLNGDGAISFDQFETEILGKYDIASSTWESGVIDARTFHRQNGMYMFNLDNEARPTTVGIDFGAKGSVVTPDHVIADDETLDITVTAYKYGDDSNDRTFRPFWGGRDSNIQRTFSHEVYLAGQAAVPVEAQEDLICEVTPNLLTAGVQPELVDPTSPLTFSVKYANQQAVDLSAGVPDARGETLVKIDPMWMHCFKDPHPDDLYYYKGANLPQYYWLRTDLHNDDYSMVCNKRLYSWTRNPFLPIKYNYNTKEGKYVFPGFVANDAGEFFVHIYTPDRRHKAKAKVTVKLPQVSYALQTITMNNEQATTAYTVPGSPDPDFVMTSVDNRRYFINITMKTAEGKLIQGLAQSTSVCEGGGGMYARWTPFFTREKHYDWVGAPSTTAGNSRRSAAQRTEYNYWLTSNGSRSYQYLCIDLNNNNMFGDPGEWFSPGAQWGDSGIRVNGSGGTFATYYPTVNRMYDDGTYARYQAWDGPFNKISAAPEGYGCGAIYNNPYEELYVFGDLSGDFRLTYRDSLNINNRGQGTILFAVDDSCKFGVLVGVSEWALMPEFSDVYGGTQPYSDQYMPQKTVTRFVHTTSSSGDIGSNDGAYALDWDAMPDKYVEAQYPKIIAKWAENGQEISKQYLDKDNYDLAYGIENHMLLEVYPADSRDLPVMERTSLTIGYGSYEHVWGSNRHEYIVFGTVMASPINPRARQAQVYYTPTGTGKDLAALDIYFPYRTGTWPHQHAYEVIKFDTIMSLQVIADTPEALKVGKSGKLVVTVVETANNLNHPNVVEGATVHIKGAGVEAEKKTDKDGKVEFNVTPTERGRIIITASVEGMKDTYETIFVESYVAPPMLDISPVAPVIASSQITIDGRTNEGCRVTVNGKPATVDEKGQFKSTIRLLPGINNIIVVATNALGQSVTKVIKVESKTTPSGIIIDKTGDFENVTQIRIRGHVEPDTKVEVTNETNGAKGEVSVVNDVFICDINVVAGSNKISVKATDKVGQTSNASADVYIWTKKSVKLQIGSRVAFVDGIPTTMSTAPVINANNTFVPLADILGALIPGSTPPVTSGTAVTVTFGTHSLVFNLNQASATLDAAPVALKAAPYILSGTVMFPLANLTLLSGNDVNVAVEILNDTATKTITVVRRW